MKLNTSVPIYSDQAQLNSSKLNQVIIKLPDSNPEINKCRGEVLHFGHVVNCIFSSSNFSVHRSIVHGQQLLDGAMQRLGTI